MTNSILKKILKKMLPQYILKARARYSVKRCWKEFENMTPKDAFTKIYADGLWGGSNDMSSDKYNSGSGSRHSSVVDEYRKAVEKLLSSFEKKPNVVDLGCGDFAVGSTLRKFCGEYIACDVVEPLINYNKKKFGNLGVDFRVLDITSDSLPKGEIVFVRQVLQHLSNEQILSFLSKVQGQYQYLVLTEHLPSSGSFTPNLDKPIGPDIRLYFDSGVVITEPPFCIKAKEVRILCEIDAQEDGRIQTMLYKLVYSL